LEGFKKSILSRPDLVSFGELAKETPEAEIVEFSNPRGYTVDPDRLKLHSQALAYQESNPGVDYITAIKKVGG
jgi:hypothetical protein